MMSKDYDRHTSYTYNINLILVPLYMPYSPVLILLCLSCLLFLEKGRRLDRCFLTILRESWRSVNRPSLFSLQTMVIATWLYSVAYRGTTCIIEIQHGQAHQAQLSCLIVLQDTYGTMLSAASSKAEERTTSKQSPTLIFSHGPLLLVH